MKPSLHWQQSRKLLSSFPCVHDAKHLVVMGQLLRQRLVGQYSAIPITNPFEFLKSIQYLWAQFSDL